MQHVWANIVNSVIFLVNGKQSSRRREKIGVLIYHSSCQDLHSSIVNGSMHNIDKQHTLPTFYAYKIDIFPLMTYTVRWHLIAVWYDTARSMIGVIQGNPLQQLSRNPLMSMRGEGSEGGVSSSSPPPLTSCDQGASSTPPPNSTRMSRTSDCTEGNVAVKTENGPEDPEIKVDDDADDIKEEIDIKPETRFIFDPLIARKEKRREFCYLKLWHYFY